MQSSKPQYDKKSYECNVCFSEFNRAASLRCHSSRCHSLEQVTRKVCSLLQSLNYLMYQYLSLHTTYVYHECIMYVRFLSSVHEFFHMRCIVPPFNYQTQWIPRFRTDGYEEMVSVILQELPFRIVCSNLFTELRSWTYTAHKLCETATNCTRWNNDADAQILYASDLAQALYSKQDFFDCEHILWHHVGFAMFLL